MAGQLDVICATSAFGMGINKADIRLVVHYHLPTTLADYVQEIGRAGRDGQQAMAIMLYAPGDENLVRDLNELTAATPMKSSKTTVVIKHSNRRRMTVVKSCSLTGYKERRRRPLQPFLLIAKRLRNVNCEHS